MSDVSRWSVTADQNQAQPPDGAPEGWKWPKVNDTIREVMAASRRWYDDFEWLDLVDPTHAVSRLTETTVGVGGDDYTLVFTAGRRVEMRAGATVVYGNVVSSAFVGGVTEVVVDENEVPLGCDAIRPHAYATLRSAAFRPIYQVLAAPSTENPAAVEDVRAFSAGEVPVRLVLPSDRSTLSTFQFILPFGPTSGFNAFPDADGTIEFWLSLDLNVLMHFRDRCDLVIQVYIGLPRIPIPEEEVITIQYSSPANARQTAGAFEPHRISIPNIQMGTPGADDYWSVWISAASGSLSNATVQGFFSALDAPTTAILKRHLS